MSLVNNAELAEVRALQNYQAINVQYLSNAAGVDHDVATGAYRKYIASIRVATNARRRAAGEHQ